MSEAREKDRVLWLELNRWCACASAYIHVSNELNNIRNLYVITQRRNSCNANMYNMVLYSKCSAILPREIAPPDQQQYSQDTGSPPVYHNAQSVGACWLASCYCSSVGWCTFNTHTQVTNTNRHERTCTHRIEQYNSAARTRIIIITRRARVQRVFWGLANHTRAAHLRACARNLDECAQSVRLPDARRMCLRPCAAHRLM